VIQKNKQDSLNATEGTAPKAPTANAAPTPGPLRPPKPDHQKES